MNIWDWFPLGWTSLISLQSKDSQESSPTPLNSRLSSKASILWHSASFIAQLSHPYTTTRKTIALSNQTFVGKVTSLLFNMLSRLVIVFLSRSKHLLISWLHLPSAVILVKSESEVAQSCPTLRDPMDCSLPGSSVHGILQARVLEWVAISFSRGSSWPRDRTWVSRIPGRCFNLWATREASDFGAPHPK